ncbi:MAG: 2-dehydropantoate 2-reductase [Eubacteriales bacterium]|nr:2-dehydropantoate 2-reductase [Eubacteriales bacterium]
MNYMVIGAGGTGGAIGAFLAKVGKDVTLIARGAHLQAIKERGIRIETGTDEGFCVPVKAASMEGCEARPDVIFVCVKGYSLAETVPFIRRISGRDTVVIPILNIYGTGRKLQQELPELTVTDGCIYVSANISAPGTIRMHGEIFRVVYGTPDHKTDDPRLQKTADDLRKAGITPVYSAQIEKDAMEKFSYVSAMAACGLYFHAEAAEMQQEGDVRAFFVQLVDEIELLAAAEGIHYETPLREINLNILDHLAPTASTSMQRDIYAGKQSEIDGLIYEVVRRADKYSLELPAYRKAAAKFRGEGL